MYTDNSGGSSNLNNEASPAFGQIPSAQLPFPGQNPAVQFFQVLLGDPQDILH